MELATSLRATDVGRPLTKTPVVTAAGAPSPFATTLQQLDAHDTEVGTLATTDSNVGSAVGNPMPPDGESLPSPPDTPVATVEDDAPLMAAAHLTTPTPNITSADTETGGTTHTTASLSQGKASDDSIDTTLPVAGQRLPMLDSSTDQNDGILTNTGPETTSATTSPPGESSTNQREIAVTDTTATPPQPLVTDATPLPTDRSNLPTSTTQPVTATAIAGTGEPTAGSQQQTDSSKAFTDTGKGFANTATAASGTFSRLGTTTDSNTSTTTPDTSVLSQLPQSAPPAHTPAPPHAALATALLANGAQPSTNLMPGATSSPMGSPAWLDSMGAQVNWMQDKGIVDAELKLHPAELGALEISINMQDDKAVVRMVAGNAQARELLEASLPRLREMFAANGLQLAHGSVAQGDSQRGQQSPPPRDMPTRDSPALTQAPPRTATTRNTSLHRIDHYV